MLYKVTAKLRKVGAIGIFWPLSDTIEAKSQQEAYQAFLNRYGSTHEFYCWVACQPQAEEAVYPQDNSDRDDNNPVDMSADAWSDFYAKHPDYDIDHDCSMN